MYQFHPTAQLGFPCNFRSGDNDQVVLCTGVKSTQFVLSRLGLVCPCCFAFVRASFSTSIIVVSWNPSVSAMNLFYVKSSHVERSHHIWASALQNSEFYLVCFDICLLWDSDFIGVCMSFRHLHCSFLFFGSPHLLSSFSGLGIHFR